jgi:hypothetical protein
VNALRACLYEFGHVVPQGLHQLGKIKGMLDEPNSDLPELMRNECGDLMKQIAEKTGRINARTAKSKLSRLKRILRGACRQSRELVR